MRPDLKSELKIMEFDFENEVKALQGIIYDNPSAIFFDVVLIKYDNNDTKKFALCKWNGTKNLRNLIRMFNRENIFYKNLARKENIYFAVTPRTKLLNFIWLDDIRLENISEKQLPYLTLIETSPGNFQAWIKLDKVYSESDIQTLKKYLILKLGADKAAAAKIQPMRLPGVYSYKHETPHYVKVYKTAERELNGEKLLKKIRPGEKQAPTKPAIERTQSSERRYNTWKKFSYYKRQLGYTDPTFNPEDERRVIMEYNDVDKKIADHNVVDIHYIYQLVIRDYSENDIFLYLQQARPDLFDKHDASDYFERTFLKALLFKKLFYPTLKLYDNEKLLKFIEEQQKVGNWNYAKKVTENLRNLISLI